MAVSLIRSRGMITKATSRHTCEEIKDAAVLQEDGIITAVGTFDDLHRKHPIVPVIGTGKEVLLPGFVNGHHHVGLTPVQLGSPDLPLELWFITRMVTRNLNLYLDTLDSAFEMIGSGITTVQHIHGWLPGKLPEVIGHANQVIKAYQDIGMRVSYCFAVRDQNRLVCQADQDFVASLPPELRGPMQRWYDRFQLSLDDNLDLFRSLHSEHKAKLRVKVQLAPANLHWCSDAALTALSYLSRSHDAPMHMHLVETAYQKEYAWRRGGCTAVEYIDRVGMLGPNFTLGHGVWLNEKDINRLAETGSCICHNCSSNFRLRSGVATLNRFEAVGINAAIGLDEAGINDDRDMLQELRLVLRAHRVPGMEEDDAPGMGQVLRMATVGGARTTPYRESLGTLEIGKGADLPLIDRCRRATRQVQCGARGNVRWRRWSTRTASSPRWTATARSRRSTTTSPTPCRMTRLNGGSFPRLCCRTRSAFMRTISIRRSTNPSIGQAPGSERPPRRFPPGPRLR